MHANDPVLRFRGSVASGPSNTALEVADQVITYLELDRLSDSIAKALIEAGYAGKRVAFTARRDGPWSYVAFLGLLKAGCAAVPLLPEGPLHRWKMMLEGADVQVMLAHPEPDPLELELRTGRTGTAWLEPAAGGATTTGVDIMVGPEAEAYIMFTSGSTGVPKGVAVSRGNLAAYIGSFLDRFNVTPSDRCSQHFALAFDLSMHDLFITWSAGACLCVPSDSGGLRAASWVRREAMDVWFSVPSLAAVMRRGRMLTPNGMPSLRLAFFCGEALPWDLVDAFRSAAPHARVVNLYGPTEATIAITYHEVDGSFGRTGTVPIGRPLGSDRVVILDEDGRSAAEGELLLSGPQVTKGYLNAPDAMARAFVRLPDDNALWYRTGDLVKQDTDGVLHFQGRVDHQVKVLGHRIEPGEVDDALRSRLEGGNAVTVPIRMSGVLRLVTFVDVPVDVPGLLEHLRTVLPSAWIPERIVVVDALPRTASGKWDRRQLKQWFEHE